MKNYLSLLLLGFLSGVSLQTSYAQNGRTVSNGTWADSTGNWSVLTIPTYANGFNASIGSTLLGSHASTAILTNDAVGNGGFEINVGIGSGSGVATGTLFILSGTTLRSQTHQQIGAGISGSAGIVNQTGGGNTSDARIDLGVVVGSVGTYNFSGGTLSSAFRQTIGLSGTGVFVQSGGTNSVGASSGLRVGMNAGAVGSYTISAGKLHWGAGAADGTMMVGDAGTGYFIQNGGEVVISGSTGTADDGFLYVGGYSGTQGTGVYSIASGSLTFHGAARIGEGGVGTLTVSGGTVRGLTGGFGNSFNLGVNAGATGVVNLTGGTLQVTRIDGTPTIKVGVSGVGIFNMGNASSAGFLTNAGTAANRAILIRETAGGTGTFQGWSRDGSGNRLSMDGILDNSGRVIANSFGNQARSLDFSSMASVTNTINNAVGENNGWLAINKGKLTLPTVAVAAGNSTVNWGESADDTTLDLVNSARLALTNVGGGGGNLTISLLATDRSDVPAGLINPIGVWDIDETFTFTSATLTLRYDDALAAQLGVSEANLKLWHYTGGTWSNITASIDLVNKRITGLSVTSFSPFAIAENFEVVVVPEPSVLLLWLGGGLTVWAIRRRRRSAT